MTVSSFAEKTNCHLVVITLDALEAWRKHSIIVRYILKLFKTEHWLRGGGHLAGNAVKCFVRLLWAAQDTWSYWCLLAARAGGAATEPQQPIRNQHWGSSDQSEARGHLTPDIGHWALQISQNSCNKQIENTELYRHRTQKHAVKLAGRVKRDFNILQIWEMNKQNIRLFCWRNNIDDLQPPEPGTTESDNWEFVVGQRGNYQGVRYLYWYLSYLWGSCRDCFIYTQPQLSANPTSQSIINTNCSHITS